MTCPNCSHPMNYVNLDQQNILHCGNCGSSFFEENAINRIGQASAKRLAADKKSDDVSGQKKVCPLDHGPLYPLEETEAIPQNITLLKCKTCRGIFVYADDLLRFKQAQAAKIEYFKVWAKPLSSIKSVLVISLTIFVIGTVIYQSSMFINRFSYPSQAIDLITKINFTRSGRYLMVFFKTKSSFQSKIIFEDRSLNIKLEKTINQKPATIHQLTTGDLNLDDEIWYQIVLTDNRGEEIKIELKKLLIFN